MSASEHSDDVRRAVAAIRRGEVIGLPTDTVYGLGADPFDRAAIGRLFAAKRRPVDVALPVLVAEPAEACAIARVDDRAAAVIERYWPGPLTVVLDRRDDVALHLGGDPATVGVRCPDHAFARSLLRATASLAVTSANVHGGVPATTAAALRDDFGDEVGVVLDGGTCDGQPSTVISLAHGEAVVLRPGEIPVDELQALMLEAP